MQQEITQKDLDDLIGGVANAPKPDAYFVSDTKVLVAMINNSRKITIERMYDCWKVTDVEVD